MNENIRTIIPPYKAISFHIIKPFYFTDHLTLLLRIVRGPAGENTNCGDESEGLAVIALRTDRLKSDRFSMSMPWRLISRTARCRCSRARIGQEHRTWQTGK